MVRLSLCKLCRIGESVRWLQRMGMSVMGGWSSAGQWNCTLSAEGYRCWSPSADSLFFQVFVVTRGMSSPLNLASNIYTAILSLSLHRYETWHGASMWLFLNNFIYMWVKLYTYEDRSKNRDMAAFRELFDQIKSTERHKHHRMVVWKYFVRTILLFVLIRQCLPPAFPLLIYLQHQLWEPEAYCAHITPALPNGSWQSLTHTRTLKALNKDCCC